MYYWNSITGQTSATPPQLDTPAPTGRADGRQRTISSLMDESVESLVTEREERALDESMPYLGETSDSDDSLDEEQGAGGAGAAIMAALLATELGQRLRPRARSFRRTLSSLSGGEEVSEDRDGMLEHAEQTKSEMPEPEPEPEPIRQRSYRGHA